MVFTSVSFLFLFLPIFLLVQNFIPYKNFTYCLFSVFFYFVGEGWYVSIILAMVLINFFFGRLIDLQVDKSNRKVATGIGVSVNLVSLLFFKYIGFFAQNLLNIESVSWTNTIHMPLGISFFTFHSISYLVDIYKREAKPEYSFINLSLYLLMFPQLIAGPIIRFHTVADQLKKRCVSVENVYYGLLLFCFGMAQKVLLADTLAGVVDPIFNHPETVTNSLAWLGSMTYGLQIYFDFSGYSNMAIGIGWITGFYFLPNFNFPYISKSITEFWRRWHMSLSRWFRDYLYIPLGGNQQGKLRTYVNLVIVFLLCGLWHGAAWNFVIWGAFHGAILVLERLGLGSLLKRVWSPFAHVYTLCVVMIGWVIFRSDSLPHMGMILKKMFVPFASNQDTSLFQILSGEEILVIVMALFFSTPFLLNLLEKWIPMPKQPPWEAIVESPKFVIGILIAALLLVASATKILTGAFSPFIYFRF